MNDLYMLWKTVVKRNGANTAMQMNYEM